MHDHARSYCVLELPLSPRHIAVVKLESGSPRARLHGAAAEMWHSKRSGPCTASANVMSTAPMILLSLTHDGEYAAAIALDE